MHRTGTVVALVLASAGIVFASGLPFLLRKHEQRADYGPRQKHQIPAEYVPDKVATTDDIQQFDLMWSHLESLQRQAAQLGPEQYKQQFVESTAAYLRLDARQAQRFADAVDKSLTRLGEARDRLTATTKQTFRHDDGARPSPLDSWNGQTPESIAARRDAWSRWRDEQRKTSDHLLSALQPIPRHDLLAERRLFWLLKLDFSLRTAEQKALSQSQALSAN